jgi:hypothetical protein
MIEMFNVHLPPLAKRRVSIEPSQTKAYLKHSPPAYLRDSWEYTGKVRRRHKHTKSQEDTQLWKPILQKNVSERILDRRRKETLQDILKAPAHMNIASLHRSKQRVRWSSAYCE